MIIFTNGRVACKPGEKKSMSKPEVKGGLAFGDDGEKLFELELAFPYAIEDANGTRVLRAGDRIYVQPDGFRQEWSRKVFVHTDGTRFVLAPESSIFAIDARSDSDPA